MATATEREGTCDVVDAQRELLQELKELRSRIGYLPTQSDLTDTRVDLQLEITGTKVLVGQLATSLVKGQWQLIVAVSVLNSACFGIVAAVVAKV